MILSSSLRAPATGLRELAHEITPAMGSGRVSRGRLVPLLALAAGGVFAVLIMLHGGEFIRAIDRALSSSWQLVLVGALFEAVSLAGYVLLLHRVVGGSSQRLRLRDSYDITLAGTAATRLLPTAGLGGVGVTVWALRAHGVRPRELTERLLAFMLLLYGVYMAALLAAGAAVAVGLVHVSHGRALGILGVVLALAVALVVLSLLVAPSLMRGALRARAQGSGPMAAHAQRAADQLPVLSAALRRSWHELRRPHPALLGAVAWWAFDIGVLVTMLHAFGGALPIPAVVLAYFLGTMFNLLPLPGSLSGGLAGALIALGTPAGAAIAAVLAYRTVAVWLPAVSGIASLASLRNSVSAWRAETDPALG